MIVINRRLGLNFDFLRYYSFKRRGLSIPRIVEFVFCMSELALSAEVLFVQVGLAGRPSHFDELVLVVLLLGF